MSNGMNSESPVAESQTIAQKAIGFLSRQLTNTESFGAFLEPIIPVSYTHLTLPTICSV